MQGCHIYSLLCPFHRCPFTPTSQYFPLSLNIARFYWRYIETVGLWPPEYRILWKSERWAGAGHGSCGIRTSPLQDILRFRDEISLTFDVFCSIDKIQYCLACQWQFHKLNWVDECTPFFHKLEQDVSQDGFPFFRMYKQPIIIQRSRSWSP